MFVLSPRSTPFWALMILATPKGGLENVIDKAIELRFNLQVVQITPSRLLFKSAPWGKIREDIKDSIKNAKINTFPLDLFCPYFKTPRLEFTSNTPTQI